MQDRYETGQWALQDVELLAVDRWTGKLWHDGILVATVVMDLEEPATEIRWHDPDAEPLLDKFIARLDPIWYHVQTVEVDLDLFMARLHDKWTSEGD